MLNYEILELDKNGIMLKLPSFYGRYAGAFFYYQTKKINNKNNLDDSYFEYYFYLFECDANKKDEFGNLLPVFVCDTTNKGMFPCPSEILREIATTKSLIFCYSDGFGNFVLSTHKLETELNTQKVQI